jgi:hypothetical protein
VFSSGGMEMRTSRLALIIGLTTALAAAPATATATHIAGAAPGARQAAVTAAPQLVAVRAASHPGYDRVVWQFKGALPSHRFARYVTRLTADPSGLPVRVAGDAVLQVTMFYANAHDPVTGRSTAPDRLVVGLPNVIEVVQSGDFEAYVTYGVGLARRQTFRLFTLTKPSRVVLDVRKDYRQSTRKVIFQNFPRYVAGTPPYTRPVSRVVPAVTPASAVLNQLFAGPTAPEYAAGLRVVRSGATDFDRLSISSTGVARVRLLGGCNAGGSTFSIADLIVPTLKQFPTVHYVKIYDPAGHTERPTGLSDSIPLCLEP